MAQVSIRKVVKDYECNAEAVKEIVLEIANQEFVVLVGPSGCGKSTTLRMIAGLEEISRGEIAIGGNVVKDAPPATATSQWSSRTMPSPPPRPAFDNMAFGIGLGYIGGFTRPWVFAPSVVFAATDISIKDLLDFEIDPKL